MKPFPGKPQAQLQAVSTTLWEGKRIITYIAGNALIILGGPNDLLQTITHEEGAKLTAVAIHDLNGKIAVSTRSAVWIYKPFGQDYGAPRWSLEHAFPLEGQEDEIYNLTWGLTEELLVGGTALTLLATNNFARQVWSRKAANPVKFVALSPDSSLIATTGWHDRLVKIWRRIYSSEDNERFDVSYLPHPTTVTELRWHGRRDPEYHAEAVLYTICADNKLRVWAATDPHGLQALQLWAELDLVSCMGPETQLGPEDTGRRFVFIIDNWEYEALVERVTHRDSNTEKDQETLKRLVDVAYRDPDICIVIDDAGNMSAWGLERVGCKARHANDVFKIAQVSGVDIQCIKSGDKHEDHATCLSFGGLGDGCEVNMLMNFFDGRIQWLTCPIDRLFYAEPGVTSFVTQSLWTGHTEVIEHLTTTRNGATVLSQSAENEVVIWQKRLGRATIGLQRIGFLKGTPHVLMARLLANGLHCILIAADKIALWSLEGAHGHEVSSQRLSFGGNGKILDCVVVPAAEGRGSLALVVSASLEGRLYRVTKNKDGSPEFIDHLCDIASVATDQPATLELAQGQKTSAHLSALSMTTSGKLMQWRLTIAEDGESATWSSAGSVDTSIKDSKSITGGSGSKAVVLDATQTTLTIWDTQAGSLEMVEQYPKHETVDFVRWTTTSDGSLILAVVFTHKVTIYAQLPFDLGTSNDTDAWTRVRDIDISELTNLPIADCAWLAGGEILTAAGNQMFAFEKEIEPRTAHELGMPTKSRHGLELFNVVSALNFTLPVFHPQYLRQLILNGKLDVVHKILATLHSKLKFYTEGDHLDSFIGLELPGDPPPPAGKVNGDVHAEDHEEQVVTGTIAVELNDQLDQTRLPHLPSAQQAELKRFITSLGESQKQQLAVDKNGFKYLVLSKEYFLEQQELSDEKKSQLSWREMDSAYRTTNQDVLVDMTTRQYQGKMLWKDARECGLFLWMTDLTALRTTFENIARDEYTKTDERNPVDCSLYYIALRKKGVLISLWRMATWNKEQSATSRLLSNNFEDAKWQTTALKNAYALLGRRRFEYAATFFLLADRLKDAVNVLATQLGDPQLAIAVARVYEGYDGPILKELLRDRVLPFAARQGDRWLAHWAFDMLNRRDMAIKCLVEPLTSVIDTKLSSTDVQQALHFSRADPALLNLYQQLRDMTVPPGQDPYPALSPADEWNFVVKVVRTYVRAGCAALALDLVRTWRFTHVMPHHTRKAPSAQLSVPSEPLRETLSPKPSALDSFLDRPMQTATTLSEPPSMLDLFTRSSPAMPKPKALPQPRQPQASMLDAFLDPEPAASYAQPKSVQPTAMVERFKRPQPTGDDNGRRATVASFTLGSSTESQRSPPANANGTQTPSMLDAYMDGDTTPTPTQTSSPTPERTLTPNMLDAFMDPQPVKKPAQTPNMLDAFMDPQPVKKPAIEVTDADGATDGNAEDVSKQKDGQGNNDDETAREEQPKEQENKVAGFGEKMQRKKVTEEPSAMSILENFDF